MSTAARDIPAPARGTHVNLSTLGPIIASDATRLRDRLRTVVAELFGEAFRPQQVARGLAINKDAASRLCTALDARDPLAVLSAMPGPVPLRNMLAAARRRGADRDAIESAEEQVQAFEGLIKQHFSSRAEFDAVIGAALPEAQERSESTSKQAVFRGMSSLRGVSSDVLLASHMIHPSARRSANRCDVAAITGFVGLRRIRPGAVVQVSTSVAGDIDAKPRSAENSPLLSAFCAPMEMPVRAITIDGSIHYRVADDSIGKSSAIDIFVRERFDETNALEPPRPGEAPFHFSAMIDVPSRYLVQDLLVHRDIWPNAAIDTMVFDTSFRGVGKPDDPARDMDRLPMRVLAEDLGFGVDRARSSRLPRYLEMLRSVMAERGWDPSSFRVFRVSTTYPVYGTQCCMVPRLRAP